MEKTNALIALAIFLIATSVFLLFFWQSFSVYLLPSEIPSKHLSSATSADSFKIVEGGEFLFEEDYSLDEIYQLIECPCCGSPIANACCGIAKQRQAFVKGLYNAGLSKKDLLLAAVKEYGMDSLLDENLKLALREELILNAPADSPVIMVEPKYHDFGNVSVAGGEVFAFVDVRNDGKSDLIIDGLSSSCGCTTVSLVVDGVEGPVFSMEGHGENPTGWSAAIAPGKTAKLKVYYNPTMHPDLRGPVTRTVTISSNSPIDFGVKVRIEATQVD